MNRFIVQKNLAHNIAKVRQWGRAIAQAVSRRLPTLAARIRAQVRSCGICGGQSGTRVGFLRVLRFLLPVLMPQTAPHSSYTIGGWYNRPISGRCTKWTQFRSIPRNLKKKGRNIPASCKYKRKHDGRAFVSELGCNTVTTR
jgi:hypothetical protein